MTRKNLNIAEVKAFQELKKKIQELKKQFQELKKTISRTRCKRRREANHSRFS